MEKIKKFVHEYLLIKDAFNVVQWITAVWLITWVLQWLFGDINAPSMSMSYVIKSFMSLSAFSVYFVGAWMIFRIFFRDAAGYFLDKVVRIIDRDKGTKDEPVFYYQTRYITDLYNISTNSKKPSECYKRLLFHFGVYFFLVLAIILSGLTLF